MSHGRSENKLGQSFIHEAYFFSSSISLGIYSKELCLMSSLTDFFLLRFSMYYTFYS